MTHKPSYRITIDSEQRLYVVVDVQTMHRLDAAPWLPHDALSDVFRRLPETTDVTLISAGQMTWWAEHTTPSRALRALAEMLTRCVDAHGFHPGAVLEYVTAGISGDDAPTLLVVTSVPPDDMNAWHAYAHLNIARGEPIGIGVLTVGDYDGGEMMLGRMAARPPRRMCAVPLIDTTFMIRTPTGSDRPDLARAPTVPPSLSPPSAADAPQPPSGDYVVSWPIGDKDTPPERHAPPSSPTTARERIERAFDVPAGSLPDVVVDEGTQYVDPERHAPPPIVHANPAPPVIDDALGYRGPAPDPTPTSDHGFGGGGASSDWSAPEPAPDPTPSND